MNARKLAVALQRTRDIYDSYQDEFLVTPGTVVVDEDDGTVLMIYEDGKKYRIRIEDE